MCDIYNAYFGVNHSKISKLALYQKYLGTSYFNKLILYIRFYFWIYELTT